VVAISVYCKTLL